MNEFTGLLQEAHDSAGLSDFASHVTPHADVCHAGGTLLGWESLYDWPLEPKTPRGFMLRGEGIADAPWQYWVEVRVRPRSPEFCGCSEHLSMV